MLKMKLPGGMQTFCFPGAPPHNISLFLCSLSYRLPQLFMLSDLNRSRPLHAPGPQRYRVHESDIQETVVQAHLCILEPLPNDLARIIYLASLRDYNSGIYLHPDLSRQYEISIAHRALQLCHGDIFLRLLESGVCDYVQQLRAYIRYAGAEERQFIHTWESLKAYRAAIPADALPIARELFFLNIDAALAVLKHRR
jgi:hypothetical protein